VKWQQSINADAVSINKEIRVADLLKGKMKAGFVDVHEKIMKVRQACLYRQTIDRGLLPRYCELVTAPNVADPKYTFPSDPGSKILGQISKAEENRTLAK
jgi:hypothetical protein